MHGPEESDSVIVAVKPTNKAEQSVAEPVEPRTENQGKRRPAKHAPGAGPGKRVTGAGTRTASSKAKEKGAVHVALAPCRSRHVENSVLRDEAGRCTRRGRHEMGDLRAGPRS